MYRGFLKLDKYYVKQTGSHIAFVPLHISNRKRCGNAVYFNEGQEFAKEREEVYERLKQEFLRLENREKIL